MVLQNNLGKGIAAVGTLRDSQGQSRSNRTCPQVRWLPSRLDVSCVLRNKAICSGELDTPICFSSENSNFIKLVISEDTAVVVKHMSAGWNMSADRQMWTRAAHDNMDAEYITKISKVSWIYLQRNSGRSNHCINK